MSNSIEQLPEGLQTELEVVSFKGKPGNKTWVLREVETGKVYELKPSTIDGRAIPKGKVDGIGIIVRTSPDFVMLELGSGQLYRDAPPPSVFRLD